MNLKSHDFSKCNSRFRLLRGWQVWNFYLHNTIIVSKLKNIKILTPSNKPRSVKVKISQNIS